MKKEQTTKTGSFVWTDGSQYGTVLLIIDGEYQEIDGVIYRHGIGKYQCAKSKLVYQGQWEMDQMHGEGTLKFESGDIFEGGWIQNHYSGNGTYTWADSSKLSGNWVDDCVDGAMVYVDPESLTWKGEMKKSYPAILSYHMES